ncbi:Retrovirus-related Pol polyprotein from transposon RE1 [Araneus ventricosus]|uniref:Retrovirus-related Pol polyprotein from transposon RE1 n=1 Tax=Araneus ventricosus TaxID=182803 RepID=A0A4Y2CP74_ARAVE|nr:Retrovirus-related Pol polyprotein from transposon RE1 [Araneus ventricosus]
MERREFTAGKIETELILEANRLQLMKQDLEKAETVLFGSASTSRKSSAVPGGEDAVPGDSSGNKWYQKEDGKEIASKWCDAMDREINVMIGRKVWDLVDLPEKAKVLGNRWVYTLKHDENNIVVRFKARLVAQGNTKFKGESFDEMFSQVINFSIVRLFFSICVSLWKWTRVQVDINNAYLYANLDATVYMRQPTGHEREPHTVCP